MIKSFRQNGEPLTITRTKLDHQIRQVERREARKAAKAAAKKGN